MKKLAVLGLAVIVVSISACAPSQQSIQQAITDTQSAGIGIEAQIQTGIAQTQAALPTSPPPMPTPKPVEVVLPTATPSPTVVVVPTARKKITADTATWPEGFSETVGKSITYNIQLVLMDPQKYMITSTNSNKLKAIAIEHPEWKAFIDYVLQLGWSY